MSRTDKDAPAWVRAINDPRSTETHWWCEDDPDQWPGPRPRYVRTQVEHGPEWHLQVEKCVRDSNGTQWKPLTQDDLDRGPLGPLWKTRTSWVFGPWVETITTIHPGEVGPCDIDQPTQGVGHCHRWPSEDRDWGTRRPSKADRRDMFHGPERSNVRQTLAQAAADWNTHGDTDIEPDRVSWSSPFRGGWWD